jgi:hypothetical protein
MTVFITVALILAVIFSFAAWFNTQVLIREMTDMKEYLDMKEEKKRPLI